MPNRASLAVGRSDGRERLPARSPVSASVIIAISVTKHAVQAKLDGRKVDGVDK